ncbi:MAG TPA: selenium metabolism-associated LysR family transcriptional regulator [Candidatus Acidoferrum sp.]|nr:selenium metabolism-associated LysR family transcriptional regulator [Candidatus Acidoferrum sp.]
METIRFDYLKTFLTVARTHSFSIAAKELATSQGTVSHHIAALETYFDAELFKRTTNGVDVTEAGATLKETAERILQDAQNAKAQISSTKQNLSGTISIAASTIPEEHIIPSLISEFQNQYPHVKFKIKAEDSLNSLNSLQANNVDFAAVGTSQGFEDKFDYIQVGQEDLVLIVSCDNELAQHESVKLNEITKHPFINREETSGTRKEIERLLENNKLSLELLNVTLELGSTESVITAVSEGRGVSIISSIAAKKAQAAGLAIILKIKEAKTSRKIYIVRPKRQLLKASESFWEFCKTFKFKNHAISCLAN